MIQNKAHISQKLIEKFELEEILDSLILKSLTRVSNVLREKMMKKCSNIVLEVFRLTHTNIHEPFPMTSWNGQMTHLCIFKNM